MTNINYADDYKAEKRLRELSRTDQNKLRAERKRKQKERLAIMSRLDELENERCDKCNSQKNNTVQCDCPAAQAIRTLGQRLLKLSDGEVEKVLKKDKAVKDTLTVDEYNAMKLKGMNDKDIMKEIRWSTVRFYDWKKKVGLAERASTVPAREIHNGKPLKGMTVADYFAKKDKKQSDALIAANLKVGPHTLQRWKRDNGLTKPQQVAEQPEGEKMMNDVAKTDDAPVVDYKAEYEAMKHKCGLVEDGLKDAQYYIAELQQQLADAKESHSEEIQKEIYSLTAENNRLKNYERDYRNLEVDYRNERTENERLRTMLDRLKHTAQINVWLMEQHVGFHKQLDEVMG